MAYDAANDPYIDQSTGVLRNKLGITSEEELGPAEAEITYVVIATIELPPSYTISDFTHPLFLQIHKEIFSPIYEWAGEIRTIDISKGSSYFAHTPFIDGELSRIFHELTTDNRLLSKDKELFTHAITHYHAELNAIHPFREGNGRVIRTFFSLLLKNLGWHIDWSALDREENIAAAIEAHRSEPVLLYKILYERISRM